MNNPWKCHQNENRTWEEYPPTLFMRPVMRHGGMPSEDAIVAGTKCTGEHMLIYGHIIWKESLFNCYDRILNLSLQIHFPWNFPAPTNLTFPAYCTPMYQVLSLLLWTCSKITTGLISKADQSRCSNSVLGQTWHTDVFSRPQDAASWGSSGSWKADLLPSFVHYWQYSGGCLVTNVVPQVNRKSHGYLVGSPWQWRKQKFCFVVKYLLSEMRCLPGWSQSGLVLIPSAQEQGFQALGWLGQGALVGTFLCSGEDEWKFKYVSLPTWEFTQGDTKFGFFSSKGCKSLHQECPLDPRFLWMAWLAHPPWNRKKAPPNQYNQTQYASAMLFIKQKQNPPKLKVQ